MDDPEELRTFANIRLIAFDLDGTLIGHQSPILGVRLAELFSTVSRSQVAVTLATGRTLTGVRAILGQMAELNRVPLVLYNGSVVMRPDHQALIAHSAIARTSVEQTLNVGASCPDGALFVYTIDADASLIGGAAQTEAVYFSGNDQVPATDFNGMAVLPMSQLNLDIAKVVAILFEVRDPAIRESTLGYLMQIPGISATSSGGRYIEVRPSGSSKAEGLRYLADHMGIQADQVLAMGDNDNDVELLRWAGVSVCVDQASPAAQRASKFISSHGAGEAAIDVLEIVRRARRLFRGERRNGENTTSIVRGNFEPQD